MNTLLINKFLSVIICGVIFTSCGQSNQNNSLESGNLNESKPVSKVLDTNKFEIMITDHYPNVENFHLLIKNQSIKEDSLQYFVDQFRKEYCSKQCNIYLYDDNSIKSLVSKYPLSNNEYLKVADRYVASSTYDMPEIWMYPFQDLKYKELGGRNWKKETIK